MKLALILATLTIAAPARAAEVFGFVDSTRAYSEATEPKAEKAELIKPVAPSVPTPPPIQPLASKAKK